LDALRSAAKLDGDLDRLATRLEVSITEVEELVADLHHEVERLDLDPAALAAAENRAAVVADLKRKYGATVEEVLRYADDAATRADEIERGLARLESISAEIAAARRTAVEAGAALADARRSAAEGLVTNARRILTTLGFRDPVLLLDVSDAEPHASGADRVELAFASDASLQPGPVAKVASGGELSRLVLAIRVAAGVADAPVVAFDEVDAGVGGSTALAMGQQLASLATASQVLVVTHLPQVAAFADQHFVVDRAGATATVRRVDGAGRLTELARMLGGMEESERGKLHAEELLALAASRRNG
jgi:DNA repair protein RecN (Recombination protein N)